jgi:ankyrin repeat protein
MINYLLTEAPQLATEKNSEGLTAICFAIQLMHSNWFHEEFIKFLIHLYPAEALKIQDSNGKTALHHCKLNNIIYTYITIGQLHFF